MQTYQIALGKTTNESINQSRYTYMHNNRGGRGSGNSFDHGIVNNLVDFFSKSGTSNKDTSWKSIYEV
jgi:hypothetical protein